MSRKRILKISAVILICVAVLFLLSGRLDWSIGSLYEQYRVTFKSHAIHTGKQVGDMNFPARYFSPDYQTSRQRFIKAGNIAGAQMSHVQLDAPGPENKALTIDIAWLGNPNPRRVILHTSGLHGVEGFAGSAIQLKILENPPPVPEDGALVFVHIMNPCGMAWLRRFNESNVDLNRNFLFDQSDWQGHHTAYPDLDKFLNPSDTPFFDSFYLQSLYHIWQQNGLGDLKQAIANGQYDYPAGLFFGGKHLEQGAYLFMNWLAKSFPKAEQMFVIDVHTGLGGWCEESLFHKITATDSTTLARELERRIIPDDTQSPVDNKGYVLKGGFYNLFLVLFPGSRVDFIAQEFGTYSNIRVLQALRQENRYHHYSSAPQISNRTKRRLKNTFNPPHPEWQISILRDGEFLLNKVAEFIFK